MDIEDQLGYTYVDTPPALRRLPGAPKLKPVTHHAMINGVNRGTIGGSFLVAAYQEGKDGNRTLLGYESILSRWHTSGCANCQTHMDVKAFIPLPGVTEDDLQEGSGVKIVPVIIPRMNSSGKLLVGGNEVPKARLRTLKTATN